MKAIKKQKGVTLLEVLVTITIMAVLFAGLAGIADRYARDSTNNLVAEHLRRVSDAYKAYIRDNFAAVAAASSATVPAYVPISTLVATGYLQPGFAAKNAYDQSVCMLVLQPAAGKLQAIVLSEAGTTIDDVSLGAIVAAAGGAAGASRKGTTTLTGTQGGWSIPRTTFHNIANSAGLRCTGAAGAAQITDGHIAYALWIDKSSTTLLSQWKDPVADVTQLPATGNNNGDTRLVQNLNRTYTWQSGAWYANGLTNEGFMRGPNNATAVNQGDSCTGSPIGSLAKDASGNLYICN
jgi:prepilin-type N-terminal cleavage/methylation domain-containing protein